MSSQPHSFPQSQEYRSYLLRVWRTPDSEGRWHAMLERISDGQRRNFTSLGQLAVFLDEEIDRQQEKQ